MIFGKNKNGFDRPYFSTKDTMFFPIPTICGCEIYIYLSTIRCDIYSPEVTSGYLCEYHKDKAKKQYILEQERRIE